MTLVIQQVKRDQLTSGQKSAIRELLVSSYFQYQPVYTDPNVWENYLKDIKGSIDHPHIETLIVAKKEDAFVGSVMIFKGSDKAYNRPELGIDSYIIRLLAVNPEERGQGIAQKLVEASLRFIQEQGHDQLVLHTSDKMQSAVRLYERMGFDRAEQYDFFVGDNHVKSYSISVEDAASLVGKRGSEGV